MTDDRTFEPNIVPDIFIDHLARIEQLPGQCRRLVFTMRQWDRDAPDNIAHVVVAKLVVPAEALAEIAEQLVADFARDHSRRVETRQ